MTPFMEDPGRDLLVVSRLRARRLRRYLWRCGRFKRPSEHLAGSRRTRSLKTGAIASRSQSWSETEAKYKRSDYYRGCLADTEAKRRENP